MVADIGETAVKILQSTFSICSHVGGTPMYESWGFTLCPFQHEALPASPEGQYLLVGRDSEIRQLQLQLRSGSKPATLEGINGIGKTSIANVAAYSLYKSHIEGNGGPLFISCVEDFQLTSETTADAFVCRILTAAAQTLIKKHSDLLKAPIKVQTSALNRYLNHPEIPAIGFGLTLGGIGFQGAAQRSLNTSYGFSTDGFYRTVKQLLSDVFPHQEGGGVICIIDNLELLKESARARDLIEIFRNSLFNIQGLKFILAGSQGIIRGAVSTPRMSGSIHAPISVRQLDEEFAMKIFNVRMKYFTEPGKHPYLPLYDQKFGQLFRVLRGNLRDTLSSADGYCLWVASHKTLPISEQHMDDLFDQWLEFTSKEYYLAVKKDLEDSTLCALFNIAVDLLEFSPDDPEIRQVVNEADKLHFAISKLTDMLLLTSSVDVSNPNRKTVQLTPKGCFVDWYRLGQSEAK